MDATIATHYDPGTSTLDVSGTFDPAAWELVDAEIDRAFRRAACRLTIDLSRVHGVPPHAVGRLVHLCNCCYPGTIVRVASRSRVAVAGAPAAAPVAA